MSVHMDTASLTPYNNTNFSLFASGVSELLPPHDFVLAGNHAHRVRGRVEELESIGRQFDGNRTALARLQVHTTETAKALQRTLPCRPLYGRKPEPPRHRRDCPCSSPEP